MGSPVGTVDPINTVGDASKGADPLSEEGSNNPTVLIFIVILVVLAMCAGTLFGMSGRKQGDKEDPLGMDDDANFQKPKDHGWSGEGLDKPRTEGLTEGFQSSEGETDHTRGETGYSKGLPTASSRSRKGSICLGELDETTGGDHYTPRARRHRKSSHSVKLSNVPDYPHGTSGSSSNESSSTEMSMDSQYSHNVASE